MKQQEELEMIKLEKQMELQTKSIQVDTARHIPLWTKKDSLSEFWYHWGVWVVPFGLFGIFILLGYIFS